MKTATSCVTLLATLLIASAAQAAEDSMTRKSNRAEWMAKGSYGIMVHYLISPQGDSAEARTAAFDQIVAGFKKAVFLEQDPIAGIPSHGPEKPDSEKGERPEDKAKHPSLGESLHRAADDKQREGEKRDDEQE